MPKKLLFNLDDKDKKKKLARKQAFLINNNVKEISKKTNITINKNISRFVNVMSH